MNILWCVVAFHVSVTVVAAPTSTTTTASTAITGHEKMFSGFIEQFENLVLNTTVEALNTTAKIYQNITKTVSPLLQHAVVPIATKYLHTVEETLKCPHNYSKLRKLLRDFRRSNIQIERLRLQLQPQHPKFEFHLMSNDFYSAGKNITEFDNLYMTFMLNFQRLSQILWDNLPEEMVEQQQELLEILNAIAKEKELSGKDKLYDEFIEMFLFTTKVDTMENCQLD